VTHRYPELDGHADFVTGTRGTSLGLDGTTPSMARMYDYHLGGCFYRPRGTRGALALCALHHALFDLGVVGITEDRRISVSGLYVARNEAGRAVDELAGKPLLIPRPRQPKVDVIYIAWHSRQVFKGAARNEATDANP
jgi:hypothetical protein